MASWEDSARFESTPLDWEDQARAQSDDPSTEGARKNIFQQFGQFAKNIAAGSASEITGLESGLISKLARGTENIGLQPKGSAALETANLQEGQRQIDSGLTASLNSHPGTIGDFIGRALPYVFAPEVKVLPKGSAVEAFLERRGLRPVDAAPIAGALDIAEKGGTGALIGSASAEGRGASPDETATAEKIGGALGAGSGILRQAAPSWLKFMSRPSKSMQQSVNPVTTQGAQAALEENAIPMMNAGIAKYKPAGAGDAADKMSEVLSKKNLQRAGLMDETGTYVDINGLIRNTQRSLIDDMNDINSGTTKADAAQTLKWLDDYRDKALRVSRAQGNPPGMLPLSDVMRLKTVVGKNTSFQEGDAPGSGRPLASRKLYTELKNKTEEEMAKTALDDQFNDVNGQMQGMAPLEAALRNRSYGAGPSPWELGSDIGGTWAALEGHPYGLAYPIASGAMRLPGTAAMMYKSPALANALSSSGVRSDIPPVTKKILQNIPFYLRKREDQ